jgi:Homeodomain-like domain/Meiotically up-regulated gene 113
MEMNSAEPQAFVYLVAARGSGLVRIGLARDPGQRLRELQVGSPLPLELAQAHPCPDRPAAEAIVAELERRFAGRRAHGHWYRLGAVDFRSALAHPATLAAPADAAAARAHSATEQARREAAFRRRRGPGSRARTEKELAYQRRRQRERTTKQRQAARLLARGRTQREAADAVGVSARTLRNWKHAPVFERALAGERDRLASRGTPTLPAPRRPRRRRAPTPERRDEPQAQPDPAAEGPRQPERPDPAAADSFAQIEARRLDSHRNWLDSNDARRGKLTPAEMRARERRQR